MEEIKMQAGMSVLFGAPAKPMAKEISDSLQQLVRSLPGVVEAHLPQCFVPESMPEPAQVLMLVLKRGTEQETMDTIGKSLSKILPRGMSLDVWPLPRGHELLRDARAAGCELKAPLKSSRWWPLRRKNAV